ncbi:MAG TPA: hypothetical protein VG498_12905, partial [Terriglobales bacterium]|nr:hypothetical protein [Terriglobales bacterium]
MRIGLRSATSFLFSAIALFVLNGAFAQNAGETPADDHLPPNYMGGAHIRHANNAGGLHGKGNIPTPHGFPEGVDTITNFTGHFEAPGFFWDGSPHHVWEYSMIGNDPVHGGTTIINAPVVPVSLDLRNADGSPRFVKVVNNAVITCANPPDPSCKPLVSDVTSFVDPFMNGPVFGTTNYSSSPEPTQFVDAVQRAEFGNHARADWHTLLAPSVKTKRTMVLIRGTYSFSLNADGTCCRFVLVDQRTFVRKLFPPAAPDNSTVIGAAEVAGDITTKDLSTFLFPNTYLSSNLADPHACCVLGFHSFDVEAGDASNGNRPRFYVMNYASWISPGLFGGGFQDITAHSHEVSEAFNDPFVAFDGLHNVTPFWVNPAGQCQDVMEDGDVIEDLPNPTFPVTMNGRTYH